MSLRRGISYNLAIFLTPNAFSGGVAAKTMEPLLFTSPTTANLV
ncbi:hypothetical protein M2E15_4934 [Bacillus mycoides]|nr:hypothetical protein M2E15_4934 [Bacillus mycoides]OSY03343.1 hypothetical protein S2E19_03032 [Bacillus mycoides]